MSAGPAIDCHAHVWDGSVPYAPDAWTRPGYVYPAEALLADMAANGISHGVIAAASLFGTDNSYTLAALARHANLRGTAIVAPEADLATLAALRAGGIVGVRLQYFFVDPLPDLAGADFQAFCGRLRDLGLHLHLNIEGHRLAGVAQVLAASGVRLVIDHFGWHDPAPRRQAASYQAMLRLLDRGNVWVKVSSGFRRPDRDLPAEYCADLIARFGPQRLLWGSDAPFVGHEHVASYAAVVADFSHYVPDPAVRAAIGQAGFDFYFRSDQQ